MAEARLDSRVSLKGAEKAAIVMMSLGPAASTAVLKQLSEEEVELITSTIAHLQNVGASSVETALQEFQEQAAGGPPLVKGGPESVRRLLIETYGPDTAMRLMARLGKTLNQRSVSFEDFRKTDPQQ